MKKKYLFLNLNCSHNYLHFVLNLKIVFYKLIINENFSFTVLLSFLFKQL
jgi:hypothetical protein